MKIVKMLVWTGFVVAAVLLLWPFVDHTASRVSMCVTGAGLVLAWYSILDLQEQRRERLWPHTIDRLMRATFVAVTLVFAVDLGVRPCSCHPLRGHQRRRGTSLTRSRSCCDHTGGATPS